MKKVLKLSAAVVATLALVVALAVAIAAWMGSRKLQRDVEIRVVPVAYAREPQALKLGKYLFETRGCAECHGSDGRGIVFVDTRDGFHVHSPNLTTGPGGVVSDYDEGDWVRAIRHGVNPKGHALFLMPSVDYNRMSDPDLAALVAYVRSLPPVAGESATIRLPLFVRALYGAGIIPDAAERIDHRKLPAPAVAPSASAEYGAYIANMCVGCHGASLSGGKIPGAPPDWPPASNLTPGEGSVLPRYDTPAKFVAMMRTGKRPDASAVSPAMPFASLRNLNDTDLQAIYRYLGTLPARRPGEA
ncbi:MAG TPA: c-type cytochrome [Usitatibacter sp.]|nr:c-type cytochrome [Usitatibacter sp.]